MKIILRNNLFAVAIHILIALIYLLFLFVNPLKVLEWIWLLLVVGLYSIAGYFSPDWVLQKQNSRLMNFLSLSLIILLGFLVWLYCVINRSGPLGFHLEWIPYFAFLPWTGLLFGWLRDLKVIGYGSELMIVFALLPTLFMWLGIELRSNKTKERKPSVAGELGG